MPGGWGVGGGVWEQLDHARRDKSARWAQSWGWVHDDERARIGHEIHVDVFMEPSHPTAQEPLHLWVAIHAVFRNLEIPSDACLRVGVDFSGGMTCSRATIHKLCRVRAHVERFDADRDSSRSGRSTGCGSSAEDREVTRRCRQAPAHIGCQRRGCFSRM
jgi:hypothetical protein